MKESTSDLDGRAISLFHPFFWGPFVLRGEGFTGLTRSFMYAGTKSILVTHWSVDAQAAKDLMVNMFRNMKRQPKPEALRKAKLKVKASMRDIDGIKVSLSHPFFWAPFMLVGESK